MGDGASPRLSPIATAGGSSAPALASMSSSTVGIRAALETVAANAETTPDEGRADGGASREDPLAEIDSILTGIATRDRESNGRLAHESAERQRFSGDFLQLCQRETRPAMNAVIELLRRAGGGGLIAPEGEGRINHPRLTMWMSFDGEIVGSPRPDHHPYLQLKADTKRMEIQVSEGDMWQGAGGGSSDRTGVWTLSDLRSDRVLRELAGILRRVALRQQARRNDEMGASRHVSSGGSDDLS